ncbi:Maf family protein [Lacticaseibacillus saniviri]
MFILASQSPRRQELLQRIVPAFEVKPAKIDERALPVLPPKEYVQQLATAKGEALAKDYPDATIIAADTMVSFHDELLGKPKDEADARRMLQELSGQTHQVYTGLYVHLGNQVVKTAMVQTDVLFWDLDEAMLETYLDTDEYADKAGAYGIQGDGALLVKEIHGDFYNVMGLPISTLYRMLTNEI